MQLTFPYSKERFVQLVSLKRKQVKQTPEDIVVNDVLIKSDAHRNLSLISSIDVYTFKNHESDYQYNISDGKYIFDKSIQLNEISASIRTVDEVEIGKTYYTVYTLSEETRLISSRAIFDNNGRIIRAIIVTEENYNSVVMYQITNNLFYNHESAMLYSDYLNESFEKAILQREKNRNDMLNKVLELNPADNVNQFTESE